MQIPCEVVVEIEDANKPFPIVSAALIALLAIVFPYAGALALVIFSVNLVRNNNANRPVQILISRIGVQIESNVFIPMDQVIDCVVTERIFAHRVGSQVIMRTVGGNIPLVGDLPYRECMSVRQRIGSALQAARDPSN